jgi:hypothetical protein
MPNDGDERPIPFLMSRWKLWKDSCQAERRRFYAGRRLAVIGKTHCDGCRAKALRQQSLQPLSAANSSLDDADSSRPGGIGQQPPEHAFQDRSQPFSPKISVRAIFASKYPCCAMTDNGPPGHMSVQRRNDWPPADRWAIPRPWQRNAVLTASTRLPNRSGPAIF